MDCYLVGKSSPGWESSRFADLLVALQRALSLPILPTGRGPWLAGNMVTQDQIAIMDLQFMNQADKRAITDAADQVYRLIMYRDIPGQP